MLLPIACIIVSGAYSAPTAPATTAKLLMLDSSTEGVFDKTCPQMSNYRNARRLFTSLPGWALTPASASNGKAENEGQAATLVTL